MFFISRLHNDDPSWYICANLILFDTFHGLVELFITIIVATLVLGSQPRQKGLQGCEPRGSLGVTSETPGSVGECEGVSHHTPEATSTLGDGVPVDSQNFIDQFEGSKLNSLWRSLYHWKDLRT